MKLISTKHIYNNEYFVKLLSKFNSRDFFYKFNKYLSLYFVFFYLYCNENETMDNKLYYNEINNYYKTQYSLEYITKIFDTVNFNKQSPISVKDIYQAYCDRKCNNCMYKDYCY